MPSLALFLVSCKNGGQDSNPYATDNPYYGPSGSYGAPSSGGGGDYVDVQPSGGGGYDSGYQAPAPAPSYGSGSSGGGGSSSGGSHTVVKGDTLYSLSRKYGTTVAALKSANGLTSDTIRLGQTLTIP